MTESPEDIPFPDQAIYEVTPGGDVVWEWASADHIEEGRIAGARRATSGSPT